MERKKLDLGKLKVFSFVTQIKDYQGGMREAPTYGNNCLSDPPLCTLGD